MQHNNIREKKDNEKQYTLNLQRGLSVHFLRFRAYRFVCVPLYRPLPRSGTGLDFREMPPHYHNDTDRRQRRTPTTSILSSDSTVSTEFLLSLESKYESSADRVTIEIRFLFCLSSN